MEPLVSIKVVTYNHFNYIGKCLDSLLAQKTNFHFEIVIGEDCSTDGTRELVFEYQKKFPEIIKVITSDKNVGVRENGIRTRIACQGKYTAICDGDDFWNDDNKLQKQVDFLESNQDYGMVYTDINVVDDKNKPIKVEGIEILRNEYKSGNIFWDLWKRCIINTNTVLIKEELYRGLDNYGANNPEKWYVYDYWFWLHIAKTHKIKFFNERSATYRYHSQGISRKKSFYHIRPFLVKLDVISNGLPEELLVSDKNKNRIVGLLLNVLFKKSVTLKFKKISLILLLKYFPTPAQIAKSFISE